MNVYNAECTRSNVLRVCAHVISFPIPLRSYIIYGNTKHFTGTCIHYGIIYIAICLPESLYIQICHTDWEEVPLDVTGNSNFYSNYQHMFNETVAVDQVVSKGDLIGYSYKSFPSEFQHLHFEIRAGGLAQRHSCNPWKYLPNMDNSYSTFEANVTLTPNNNSLPCEAVVDISVPPDQLTFNRIELHVNGGDVIRVFDMCEDNLEHSFDELDLPLLEGNIYITPNRFNSQSYGKGEPLTYGFEFLDLPTPGGTVVAKAYDVFGNFVETPQATYVCPGIQFMHNNIASATP